MKAFLERQKLSTEMETMLQNNQEDDRVNDFLQRALIIGHRYVMLVHGIKSTFTCKPSCRYKITADIGGGHKVLGKVMMCSQPTTSELDKLRSDLADVDVSKCIVDGRVLLSPPLQIGHHCPSLFCLYERHSSSHDQFLQCDCRVSYLNEGQLLKVSVSMEIHICKYKVLIYLISHIITYLIGCTIE